MTAHERIAGRGDAGYPRALADIGATNARFALETEPGRLEHKVAWLTAQFPDFVSATRSYFALLPGEPARAMAVAIACPVSGDRLQLTNGSWDFSAAQARELLGLERLAVINDFAALALALPSLPAAARRQVGGGVALPGAPLGLLGPGSGFGVTGLLPAAGGWAMLGTEGGHASFAPADEREVQILRYAWQQFPHVSLERLLSGPGLELIHAALCARDGALAEPTGAAQISDGALAAGDARCAEAIDCFCAILGTAAANLALTIDARGGVYLGGGIVPRLGTRFDASPFRERFEAKGRFSERVRQIPTFVITAEDATLRGASTRLDA